MPPPLDIASSTANSAASRQQAGITAAARNQANGAVANTVESSTTALPPPLSAGAHGLGNALYTLMTAPPVPASGSNATKMFAFGLALAIAMFVWCLIKNFIHSLPIIGIFVPACTNDEMGIPRAINNLDQQALANFLRNENAVSSQFVSPSITPSQRSKTFEEFIQTNPGVNSDDIGSTANNLNALTNGSNQQQQPTTANIINNSGNDGVDGTQNLNREPQNQNNGLTTEGLRKLFGL